MTGIWTVARQTFVQCLRMRMALGFIIMLAVALAGVGITVKGDGTLNGRIRTFLDYSFVITVLIPGIMTIFLTVGMVAGDVRRKQIFMILTKPLARWHYVLGRWLGVMMLNALLLSLAAAAIYGVVQYLKSLPALNLMDRLALMNGVLTARESIPPMPPDIEGEMARRLKALTADSRRYEQAIEAYQTRETCSREQAIDLIQKEMHKQIMEDMQTVGPSRVIGWKFPAPNVHGSQIRGTVKVLLVEPKTGQVVAEADESLTCQMVVETPIEINEMRGMVSWADQKLFEARFKKEQIPYFESKKISPGQHVPIAIDPAIQLSYKPVPTGSFADMPFVYGIWRFSNDKGMPVIMSPREDPSNQPATLTIPASVANNAETLKVEYRNLNSPGDPMFDTEELRAKWPNPNVKLSTLRFSNDQISLLYRVGTFEANFLKAILMVLLELAFLAAMGGLLGSFLSLPVGSVFALVMLLFGRMQDFAVTAAGSQGGHGDFVEYFCEACGYFLRFLAFFIPDLAAISPEAHLADGIRITWPFVSVESAAPMLARCAAMLGAACLIFRRRELGRVQV
ncbi:MAG: ABC transporter permease [Planctomycetes bacterium]|nr:ABC transporter permease [Planctomycetota bacterium]